MEKLVFEVKVAKSKIDYGVPIRVRKSVSILLDEISAETGLSKVSILEKMVEFAYNNTEIKYIEE